MEYEYPCAGKSTGTDYRLEIDVPEFPAISQFVQIANYERFILFGLLLLGIGKLLLIARIFSLI